MKRSTFLLSAFGILAMATGPVLADDTPVPPPAKPAATAKNGCGQSAQQSHRSGMHHGGQQMHDQMMEDHRQGMQPMQGHQPTQGGQQQAARDHSAMTGCGEATRQSHRSGMHHGGQQMHDQMMDDHRQGMQPMQGHAPKQGMQGQGMQGQPPQGQPGMNMGGGCSGSGCGNKSQSDQSMPMKDM